MVEAVWCNTSPRSSLPRSSLDSNKLAEWDEKNGEYKLKSEMKGLVEALGAGRVSKKLCLEAP